MNKKIIKIADEILKEKDLKELNLEQLALLKKKVDKEFYKEKP